MRSLCRILIGRPEGNSSLKRSGPRWEDNIETNLRKIDGKSVNRLYLAQDRYVLCAGVNGVMTFDLLAK
jgi:hypothetical protein